MSILKRKACDGYRRSAVYYKCQIGHRFYEWVKFEFNNMSLYTKNMILSEDGYQLIYIIQYIS